MDKITTPDSSNVASYAYSPARSVFTVEYKDKDGNITATWEYVRVPPERFEEAKRPTRSVDTFAPASSAITKERRFLNSEDTPK